MAVVKSGISSTGARWRIHDDEYIDNTPEQNEALRLSACRIAHDALVNEHVRRQRGEQHAEDCRNDRGACRRRAGGHV